MRRITRGGLRACAGAAALALSMAAVAQAQEFQVAPQPMTGAEMAASPQVKRLTELLAAVNSGDAAALRAYLEANTVNYVDPKQSWQPWLLPPLLELYRTSRGVDLVRVTTVTLNNKANNNKRDFTTAILRNRITG